MRNSGCSPRFCVVVWLDLGMQDFTIAGSMRIKLTCRQVSHWVSLEFGAISLFSEPNKSSQIIRRTVHTYRFDGLKLASRLISTS